MRSLTIGNTAGHHFWGPGDLEVVKHCTIGERRGYYHTRKWLANKAAFEYDPAMGWAWDRWFTWLDEPLA